MWTHVLLSYTVLITTWTTSLGFDCLQNVKRKRTIITVCLNMLAVWSVYSSTPFRFCDWNFDAYWFVLFTTSCGLLGHSACTRVTIWTLPSVNLSWLRRLNYVSFKSPLPAGAHKMLPKVWRPTVYIMLQVLK